MALVLWIFLCINHSQQRILSHTRYALSQGIRFFFYDMAQPSETLRRNAAATAPSESLGVRKQVWLVAGITLILACVMATYVEMKPRTVRMGMATLPMAVLFPFVFYLLGNSLLKRLSPGVSLSSAELRLLFCTLWVGGVFPGTNWATAWAGRVGAARYFASAENRWQELIFDDLPWWMFLADSPGVLRGFYEGLEYGEAVPWAAWVAPSFWAISAALAITGIGLGLTAIFQKQWARHERLAFPLSEVALELTAGFDRCRGWPPFMRTWAFWVGFFIAALPELWDMVSWFVPDFPRNELWVIHQRRLIDISRHLPPNTLQVRLLPNLMGFTFLCNLDILFGIWSVYAIAMTALYGMNRTGFSIGLAGQTADGAEILNIFTSGAMVGLVVWAVWVARGHLKRVFQQARASVPGEEAETAILSPRMALAILIGSLLYLFFWVMHAGYEPHLALLWVGLFAMGLFAAMKFLAASGFPYIYPPFPATSLSLLGTRGFSESSLVGQGLVNNHLLAGWRVPQAIPHVARLREGIRNTSGLIWGGVILGMLITIIYAVWLCYQFGGIHMDEWLMRRAPRSTLNRIAGEVANTQRPVFDLAKATTWILGGAVAVLFGFLQARLPWWPAHPLGLMLFTLYPIRVYMLNIFLVWLAKFIVLRFGGIQLYRRLKPACYGLIVGFIFSLSVGALIDFIWFPDQGHLIHSW